MSAHARAGRGVNKNCHWWISLAYALESLGGAPKICRGTHKKNQKHPQPDLEPTRFDRVMQSNLFILIPEAIRAPLMRTLFFLYTPPPQRLNSIYIYLHGRIIQHVLFFLRSVSLHHGYVRVCTGKKKKYTGIEKIPGLIRLNPIDRGPKHAVFGMWLQFVLGWA